MSQFFLSGKTQRINSGGPLSLDDSKENIFSTLAAGLDFLICASSSNKVNGRSIFCKYSGT